MVTGSATVMTATAVIAVTSSAPATVTATTTNVSVNLAGQVTTVRWLVVQAYLLNAQDMETVEPANDASAIMAGTAQAVISLCVHMTVMVVAIVLQRVTRQTPTASVKEATSVMHVNMSVFTAM